MHSVGLFHLPVPVVYKHICIFGVPSVVYNLYMVVNRGHTVGCGEVESVLISEVSRVVRCPD